MRVKKQCWLNFVNVLSGREIALPSEKAKTAVTVGNVSRNGARAKRGEATATAVERSDTAVRCRAPVGAKREPRTRRRLCARK